jgi:hypothetical protein
LDVQSAGWGTRMTRKKRMARMIMRGEETSPLHDSEM